MEYVQKRLASALSEISRGPQDSLEHHLIITVARALVAPTSSRFPPESEPRATFSPSHSLGPLNTPNNTACRNMGGDGGGGGGLFISNVQNSDSRRNHVEKKEVERLQRKMEQLQKTTERLQKELEVARLEGERARAAAAEAEQARVVQHLLDQESEREVAEREKTVTNLERELAQERQDCAHYKDSYEHLQRSKDELEEHVQQVEKARNYFSDVFDSSTLFACFIICFLLGGKGAPDGHGGVALC